MQRIARTGRPFGREEFKNEMGKELGRSFTLKLPGRPRKKSSK